MACWHQPARPARRARHTASPLLDLNAQGIGMEVDALSPEELALLRRIRVRKVRLRAAHQRQKAVAGNQAVLPRTADPERKLTTSRMRVRPGSKQYFACGNS